VPSPTTIPVMPMRHDVVYPGIPTPLGVRRTLSQLAIEAARQQRRFLFTVTQRSPVEDPSLDDLHRVGSLVKVIEVKPSEGELEVLVQGVTRARATLYLKEGSHLTAAVEPIFDRLPDDRDDPAFVAIERELRARLLVLGQLHGVAEPVLNEVLTALREPGVLADFVASYLELPTLSRQALLETPSVAERMDEVLRQLTRQIEVERTRDEIRVRVKEQLGSRQREAFLREQLKVIREELGDDEALRPDELTSSDEERSLARAALASLSGREREVLELRYGVGEEEPRTLRDVGRQLGLTRERIRQIEKQAVAKLRRRLDSGRIRARVTGPSPSAASGARAVRPPRVRDARTPS